MEALKTFDIEELLKRQAMLSIARRVGATEEEFLKVHHEKWLKNMNERTKGEY